MCEILSYVLLPEKTSEPPKPSEPSQPSEPTEPSKPSEPSEPSDPSEPSERSRPSKPLQLHCRGVECQHGGSCVEAENDFECKCQEGYTGILCEIGQPCSVFYRHCNFQFICIFFG